MRIAHLGFTVIELLIIVVLLGLVAAVAYPKYEHYTARSEVGRVVALAANDQQALSNYYMQKGALPADQAALSAARIQFAGPGDSPYLAGPAEYRYAPGQNESGGTIRLRYPLANISDSIDGRALTMTGIAANKGLEWRCRAPKISDADLPAQCVRSN